MTRQRDESAAAPGRGAPRGGRAEGGRAPGDRADEPRGAGSAGRRAGVGAHGSAGETYYYRRRLGPRDLLTAAGIGLGAGAVAFYIASLLLQRTPLEVPRPARRGRPAGGAAARTRDAGMR